MLLTIEICGGGQIFYGTRGTEKFLMLFAFVFSVLSVSSVVYYQSEKLIASGRESALVRLSLVTSWESSKSVTGKASLVQFVYFVVPPFVSFFRNYVASCAIRIFRCSNNLHFNHYSNKKRSGKELPPRRSVMNSTNQNGA